MIRRSKIILTQEDSMRKKLVQATALAMSWCMIGGTVLTCSAQEQENIEVSDNFNAEGLPILNEKETFTIAVVQTSSLKSAAEKACVLETEEATNVHIEWVEIPKSGWTEKINIMFSTDSLPDAIIGDVDMARNYEQLTVLDDYLEAYAPNVTAFFETRDDYPNALLSPDGTVRTLPIGDESVHNIIDSQLWINQKWLDQLNLQTPETPEELKEVLIAFRDQDPNGNGIQDEIPFTFEDAWGWGNTIENWGISILIILGAIIIVKLLSLLGKKVIKPFVTGTDNHLDDVIFYSLEAPVKFAIILLGIWIAIHRLVYPDSFVKVVDNAYSILIVLDITWFFGRLFSSLLQVYWGKQSNGQANKMMPIIKRTILVIVWLIGIVMALSNVGVNISALLGTLGIGGIAFALAAQDTVKNVFGTFTILTDKPFSIGDTIRVDSYEGTVVDVGVRSTKIMNYDKRIITFPNYKITDTSIVNISSEPMRRVVLNLGLTYDTTSEKMKEALELLKSIPKRVENVSSNPSDIVAVFTEYSDSALVIMYIYFIEKQGDILGVTSNMNMEILAAFNKAGLNLAFPTRTVYIQKDESLKQES